MEQLLLDLINRFSQNIPELVTVDEDYGQLEMINREDRSTYPLVFPAVLIDAPDVTWSNIAGLSQKGEATIRVRLIIDCYDDTHAGSGTTNLIEGRAELRARVHRLIQGFRVNQKTQLIRTSSRFYTWDHGIKVYEQTYTGTVTEMIQPEGEQAQATPRVTDQVIGPDQGAFDQQFTGHFD
ncbi:MAG: hypothetical protein IJ884_05695 [Bacteroidales bacterium]|nr:hypothetical protein [Bacteroidales bacterium]